MIARRSPFPYGTQMNDKGVLRNLRKDNAPGSYLGRTLRQVWAPDGVCTILLCIYKEEGSGRIGKILRSSTSTQDQAFGRRNRLQALVFVLRLNPSLGEDLTNNKCGQTVDGCIGIPFFNKNDIKCWGLACHYSLAIRFQEKKKRKNPQVKNMILLGTIKSRKKYTNTHYEKNSQHTKAKF